MSPLKGEVRTAYYLNCVVCGKEFRTVPTSDHQKTCSRKCVSELWKLKRVKCYCSECGSDFTEAKKRSAGRKYCSTNCKISALAKARRRRWEKIRQFGKFENYRELKKYLIEKYRGCQICGWNIETSVLEYHHLDLNRKNNSLNNVLLLCPNCHTIEHYKSKTGQFRNNLGKAKVSNAT